MKTFTEKVYDVVAKVAAGKVITYAEVAKRAGSPKAVRAVGNIMNKNPDMVCVPCHRVIRSDYSVGGYAHGSDKKIAILIKEGVSIVKGKVHKEHVL